jgi:hypothetical protein
VQPGSRTTALRDGNSQHVFWFGWPSPCPTLSIWGESCHVSSIIQLSPQQWAGSADSKCPAFYWIKIFKRPKLECGRKMYPNFFHLSNRHLNWSRTLAFTHLKKM